MTVVCIVSIMSIIQNDSRFGYSLYLAFGWCEKLDVASCWRHHSIQHSVPPICRWYAIVCFPEPSQPQWLVNHRKLRQWRVIENALLLNPTKTEAVIFGTTQRLSQVNRSQGVRVAGADVQFADTSNCSEWRSTQHCPLTSTSLMSLALVTTTSVHFAIRPLLTLDTAKAMAVAIVGSRLDYCNSVLYGMSQANTNRIQLQRVQNILAWVVSQAPWTVSSVDICRDLHWLPVSHCVTSKLCLISWRTLHITHPPYLSELINHCHPSRVLRSSNTSSAQTFRYH